MPTIKCPPSAYIMTRQGKAFWAPREPQGPQTLPVVGPEKYQGPAGPEGPVETAPCYPRYPRPLEFLREFSENSDVTPVKKFGAPGGRGKGPERRRYPPNDGANCRKSLSSPGQKN